MSRFVIVAGIVALVAGPLPAQKPKEDVFLQLPEKPGEHEKILKEALPKAPEDAPITDAMKKSVEIVVQYHVYKLTQQEVQSAPKVMSNMVDICEAWIRNVFTAKEVQHTELKKVFHAQMLKELDRVLRPPDQSAIVRVNASRVVARLADRAGQEETADLLVKVLSDSDQVDGARYYACQGLKELMLKTPRTGPGIKDAKRRAEVVSALVAFIERKPPFSPSSIEEEDGLRVLRREAVRALAEVREPLITGVANGHSALCLCRVVGKDVALSPVPRIDEQVEAAIGLGRMPVDAQKEFVAGYAANLIGKFVVEFAQAYKGPKNKREPWKVYAARLDDALKAMAATFNDPGTTSVQNLATGILESVVRDSGPNTDPLSNFVDSNPPAQKQVYKSDPKSAVTPRPAMKE